MRPAPIHGSTVRPLHRRLAGGRSLGVTGHFERAEAELKRSMELDAQSGGETHWDLTELGRLNQARHKYAEAIGWFEKDLPLLDAADAAKHKPVEMAALLADYADCLRHVGRTADADQSLATRHCACRHRSRRSAPRGSHPLSEPDIASTLRTATRALPVRAGAR